MEDSNTLSESEEPCIIISASGMMSGGRVITHIKHMIGDKNSTILFVGYCAEGSLGRRIQDSRGEVSIFGEKYRIRCKVESISGLSAHGDLEYLTSYVENVVSSNAIKQIFLVHGESNSIINFKRILNSKGIYNVTIPELGTTYTL